MPVEVVEKFESRLVTIGPNPTAELRYAIRGTNDDVQARSALTTTSPLLFDLFGTGLLFLPRESITVEPVGDLLWEGVARYSVVPATNESVFAFDTGGGTQHITHSLGTVARHAPSGQTAPDFKGAIGVTADSVEGVDISVPVYNFSETHYVGQTQGLFVCYFRQHGRSSPVLPDWAVTSNSIPTTVPGPPPSPGGEAEPTAPFEAAELQTTCPSQTTYVNAPAPPHVPIPPAPPPPPDTFA